MFSVKSFLTLLFVLFLAKANAQFKKGDKMVGATVASIMLNSGNADISEGPRNFTSKEKEYTVNLTPNMGWFLSEKLIAGSSFLISTTRKKTSYEQNSSTYQSDKTNKFNIGVGGFIRNYWGNSGKNKPFGQFSINTGYSSQTIEGFFYYNTSSSLYKYTYKGNSSGGFFMNATFSGGITKMLGDFTGLDIFAGYSFNINNYSYKTTQLTYQTPTDNNPIATTTNKTSKFTNHGFLLGVGFQVFLSRKK